MAKRPVVGALILLAALALRVLVPAGFMPVFDHGGVRLALCPGGVAVPPKPMAGMMHHQDDQADVQKTCAFADLALPVLGGADPVQLAVALFFVIACALFVAAAAPIRADRHRRPPLRGPPRFV